MGYMLPRRENPADYARNLIKRKENIEADIEAQHQILSANASTLTTPLVDHEGFPRDDIDVWAVRTARVRIIELRNDYTAVLDEIGTALQDVYSHNPPSAEDSETESSIPPPSVSIPPISHEDVDPQLPFARVDGVAPGSPADVAGLKREDLVLSFGHLTIDSFPTSSLQPLADLVGSRENLEIEVKVVRGDEERRILKLVPRRGWGGRGLLG